MRRRRDPNAPTVVYRTARGGLRLTRGQRRRLLAASGPGTFGELDTAGARSVLGRYADAWQSAAKRRRDGDRTVRFPRTSP
jgi:hypothetical protein